MLKCFIFVVCGMCIFTIVFCAPGYENVREKQSTRRHEPSNQTRTAVRIRRQTKDSIDTEFVNGFEITGLQSKETFILSPLNEQSQEDRRLKAEVYSILASLDKSKDMENCNNNNCLKYSHSATGNLPEDRTVRNSEYDNSNYYYNRNQYFAYSNNQRSQAQPSFTSRRDDERPPPHHHGEPPPPPPPPPYHGGPPPSPPPHHHGGPPPPHHHGGPPPSPHHGGPPPPPHHGGPPPPLHHGGPPPPPHHGGPPPPPHHGGPPPPPHHGGPPPPPHHGGPPPPPPPPPPSHGGPSQYDDKYNFYDQNEYDTSTSSGSYENNNYHTSEDERRTRQSSYYNDGRPPSRPHFGGPPPPPRYNDRLEEPPHHGGPPHRDPPPRHGGPPPPPPQHENPPQKFYERPPDWQFNYQPQKYRSPISNTNRNPSQNGNQGEQYSNDNKPAKLVDATQNENSSVSDDGNYMLDIRFADGSPVQTTEQTTSSVQPTSTRPSPLQFQAVAVTPEDGEYEDDE